MNIPYDMTFPLPMRILYQTLNDIVVSHFAFIQAAYEFSAERADSHLRHIKHAMISSITFASEDEVKFNSSFA